MRVCPEGSLQQLSRQDPMIAEACILPSLRVGGAPRKSEGHNPQFVLGFYVQ